MGVDENDKVPCIDCLVLAECRQRMFIDCNRLYYWITTIDRMYEAQIVLPKPIVLPESDDPKEGENEREYTM